MSQNLLAIETSQRTCSVAVSSAGGNFSESLLAERQHADLLLPMVHDVLARAELELRDLNAIAFSAGPGSFTGVRIAASVTQGLAFGANCEVIRLSSLAILAETLDLFPSITERRDQAKLVVLDAHMGELYVAQYARSEGKLEAVLKDSLMSAHAALQFVEQSLSSDSPCLLAGNGIDILRELAADNARQMLAEQLQAITPELQRIQPDAVAALNLASELYQAGTLLSPEQAIPIYLREKDAWQTLEQQKIATNRNA